MGRVAVDLPWLCPNTDSLIGLAEQPAALVRLSAADPGLLTFLLRFAAESGHTSPSLFPLERLRTATLPETAAAYLRATPAGWLDPSARIVAKAAGVGSLAAGFARRLAQRLPRVSPELAEVTARLAPLGWYAVAAVDASDALGCLRDPEFGGSPAETQRCWWGLDHDAIARRLAMRWRLPATVAGCLGHLGLSFAAARLVVPDAALFAVVQLAVSESQSRSHNLGLVGPVERGELFHHLGLDPTREAGLFDSPVTEQVSLTPSGLDPNPHKVPLVRNLLRMAGEARRRTGASLAIRLEERIDELHRAAADLAGLAGERLRNAKLAGLAELAAGAGHEINNPLAVISGNAQRLLRTEADADRADSLRAVVRQTQRISGILRDLMQFARPPRPERERFAVAELMAAVREELAPAAAESGVRLELANLPAGVRVTADARQLRRALGAILRNAIEAAPRGSWARLGCEVGEARLQFVVEDGGPGLSACAREHAFDPFFCGRSAGRGRGLGLSTAWQLARQNGGDLNYEPMPDGPTRFVLIVPLTTCEDRDREEFDRRCA